MKISVSVNGLDAVRAAMAGVSRAVPYAVAAALTRIAHMVRAAVIDEMARMLDRPTNYAMRQAIQVVPATRSKLESSIGLGIKFGAPGKGTPYVKALGHLFTGGSRDFKRMEGAFRAIRALPSGFMMVPGAACPLDAYGNPHRSFVVQLISYFNAFNEQGYKANMTDKRRKSIAKAGNTASGYKTINGVQYFISYGHRGKPGGDRYTNGRAEQHLPAGIWARSGIHGSVVKPIFIFVRRGQWRQMISLEKIARAVVDQNWESVFDKALNEQIARFSR